MLTIHLHNLEFSSNHGVQPGEELTGGRFVVSLDIDLQVSMPVTDLSQSLDYGMVYQVVKNSMHIREYLLETLAEKIISEIRLLSENIRSVRITIKKLNPPLQGFQGEVGVSLLKEY